MIIRTASEGVTQEALERDVRRLQAQWEVVKENSEKTGPSKPKAPVLLYEEPDMLIKVVRDQFNDDFSRLVVSGDDAWETVSNYVGHVAPELAGRLHRHVGSRDVFEEYRIDEQLLKALDRKVWLPSGGTLVIDRTEAMTVIDVNTGKFTGSGGNLEETVTRNNLEAAEEIVRQLRLRDIGGIIVIDFIDMVLEANRDLVLRRLTECLARDRTRHQVAEVTSLGLVQMTRKRVGGGLLEHFSTPCEHCRGRGVIVSTEPVAEPAARGGERDGEPVTATASATGTATPGAGAAAGAAGATSRAPEPPAPAARGDHADRPAGPRRRVAGRRSPGAGGGAHRGGGVRGRARRPWSPRPWRACATTSRRSSSSRGSRRSGTGTRRRAAGRTAAPSAGRRMRSAGGNGAPGVAGAAESPRPALGVARRRRARDVAAPAAPDGGRSGDRAAPGAGRRGPSHAPPGHAGRRVRAARPVRGAQTAAPAADAGSPHAAERRPTRRADAAAAGRARARGRARRRRRRRDRGTRQRPVRPVRPPPRSGATRFDPHENRSVPWSPAPRFAG